MPAVKVSAAIQVWTLWASQDTAGSPTRPPAQRMLCTLAGAGRETPPLLGEAQAPLQHQCPPAPTTVAPAGLPDPETPHTWGGWLSGALCRCSVLGGSFLPTAACAPLPLRWRHAPWCFPSRRCLPCGPPPGSLPLWCALTRPRAPRASQLVLTGCGALVRPT